MHTTVCRNDDPGSFTRLTTPFSNPPVLSESTTWTTLGFDITVPTRCGTIVRSRSWTTAEMNSPDRLSRGARGARALYRHAVRLVGQPGHPEGGPEQSPSAPCETRRPAGLRNPSSADPLRPRADGPASPLSKCACPVLDVA